MSDSDLRTDYPGELFGRMLMAAQALPGQVCFLKTKVYRGLALIDRFEWRGSYFRMSAQAMRDLPLAGQPPALSERRLLVAGAIPFQVDGLWLNYRGRTEFVDPHTVRSAGSGSGVVVHHPPAVAALSHLRKTASSQQVIDAVNWGTGLPPEVLVPVNRPFVADGLAVSTRPRLQVCGGRADRLLRLDGLPPPACPVLGWSLADPTEAFIGVINAVLPQARAAGAEAVQGGLMAHLVDCDRRHRQLHPTAVPAVEASPALLYAHRPILAGFFHFEVDGTRVNHDLAQADVERLMRDLAGFMGWDFSGADR